MLLKCLFFSLFFCYIRKNNIMENPSRYLYINTTKTRNENKSGKAFIKLELFMNKVEAIATVSFTLWLHCRLSEIELIVSNLALRGTKYKKQEEEEKNQIRISKASWKKQRSCKCNPYPFCFFLHYIALFLTFEKFETILRPRLAKQSWPFSWDRTVAEVRIWFFSNEFWQWMKPHIIHFINKPIISMIFKRLFSLLSWTSIC